MGELRVDVQRVNLNRLLFGQSVVLFAFVTRSLVKHQAYPFAYLGVAAMIVAVIALLSSRRRLGVLPLEVRGDLVQFSDGLQFSKDDVARWSFEDARARIQAGRTLWLVRPQPDDQNTLLAALTPLLGTPVVIVRRGSRAARTIAILTMPAAAFLIGVAYASRSMVLLGAGIVAFVVGLSCTVAFFQKIPASDAQVS